MKCFLQWSMRQNFSCQSMKCENVFLSLFHSTHILHFIYNFFTRNFFAYLTMIGNGNEKFFSPQVNIYFSYFFLLLSSFAHTTNYFEIKWERQKNTQSSHNDEKCAIESIRKRFLISLLPFLWKLSLINYLFIYDFFYDLRW
jgi:hypothetical protein